MEFKINKTENYDLFKFGKSNRLILSYHLTKLIKSIQENDKTKYNPIIVNSDMEIIDGQHRFKACEFLKKPIYYVIDNMSNHNDIIYLNSSSKLWVLEDYLNYYVQEGVVEYIKLKEFGLRYNLSAYNCFIILKLGLGKSLEPFKAGTFKMIYYQELQNECLSIYLFKAGTFKMISYQEGIDFMEILDKFAPYVKNYRSRAFIVSVKRLFNYPNFDFVMLFRRLKKHDKIVPDFGNSRDYLKYFEDIYNRRMAKKN